MKKKILYIVCAAVLVFCFTACGDMHSITVVDGDEIVQSCPSQARTGEIVVVKTLSVCDADVYISVNGDKDACSAVRDGRFEFEMPDRDVNVKVWVEGNGLADQGGVLYSGTEKTDK